MTDALGVVPDCAQYFQAWCNHLEADPTPWLIFRHACGRVYRNAAARTAFAVRSPWTTREDVWRWVASEDQVRVHDLESRAIKQGHAAGELVVQVHGERWSVCAAWLRRGCARCAAQCAVVLVVLAFARRVTLWASSSAAWVSWAGKLAAGGGVG